MVPFLREKQNNPNDVWGLDTGIPELNRWTGGLHGGEVTIVAAPTSVGKTQFVMQLTWLVVERLHQKTQETGEFQGKVMVISPEMTQKQLILRRACSLSNTVYLTLMQGRAGAEAVEAVSGHLEAMKPLVDHLSSKAGKSVSLADINNAVYRSEDRDHIRLIVIDYAQRIHHKGKTGFDEQSQVAGDLKDMANELNVPIVLVSQFNRDYWSRQDEDTDELPTPKLSDIRGTGRFEEEADNVWFLYRRMNSQDAYSPFVAIPTDLVIAKARHGPANISVQLDFVPGPGVYKARGAS